MSWFEPAIDWLSTHRAAASWLSALSLILLIAMPIVAAWAIAKLPTDYFIRKNRRPLETLDGYPVLRGIVLTLKSVFGVLLVLAGILMLITPGQGVLTLLAGIILLEFPGKYRLECWLVSRRQVWRSLNGLRRRTGRPELKKPTQAPS
jgi:hypothetical protein